MSAYILVIEAEPAMQQLIGLNLGRAGHRVTCVPDAEAALALIDQELPEMLLLEWDLPGQNGIAPIRRLRAHPDARDVPIIMVSRRTAPLPRRRRLAGPVPPRAAAGRL
jgi:two-component system phosphate regulon response regulator PhoB